MKVMLVYIGFFILFEYMIEWGWIKCFVCIEDVGWFMYVGLVIVYLVVVEFGIYWMYREFYDIKFLYKYLYVIYYIYNK